MQDRLANALHVVINNLRLDPQLKHNKLKTIVSSMKSQSHLIDMTLRDLNIDAGNKGQINIDIPSPDTIKDTPLMAAIRINDENSVRFLLKHKARVNAQNAAGDTALMIAVKNGFDNCVEILLSADADVNLKNLKKRTALMYAAFCGTLVSLNFLIKKNAALNIQSDTLFSNDTALSFAVKRNRIKHVAALLEADANTHLTSYAGVDLVRTPLAWAIEMNHIDIIALLLEHNAPIMRDPRMLNTYFKDKLKAQLVDSKHHQAEYCLILLEKRGCYLTPTRSTFFPLESKHVPSQSKTESPLLMKI